MEGGPVEEEPFEKTFQSTQKQNSIIEKTQMLQF